MTNTQILRIVLCILASRLSVERVGPYVRVTHAPVGEPLSYGDIHRLGTYALVKAVRDAANEHKLRTTLAYRMATGASVPDAKAWTARMSQFDLDPDLTDRLDAWLS